MYVRVVSASRRQRAWPIRFHPSRDTLIGAGAPRYRHPVSPSTTPPPHFASRNSSGSFRSYFPPTATYLIDLSARDRSVIGGASFSGNPRSSIQPAKATYALVSFQVPSGFTSDAKREFRENFDFSKSPETCNASFSCFRNVII